MQGHNSRVPVPSPYVPKRRRSLNIFSRSHFSILLSLCLCTYMYEYIKTLVSGLAAGQWRLSGCSRPNLVKFFLNIFFTKFNHRRFTLIILFELHVQWQVLVRLCEAKLLQCFKGKKLHIYLWKFVIIKILLKGECESPPSILFQPLQPCILEFRRQNFSLFLSGIEKYSTYITWY